MSVTEFKLLVFTAMVYLSDSGGAEPLLSSIEIGLATAPCKNKNLISMVGSMQ